MESLRALCDINRPACCCSIRLKVGVPIVAVLDCVAVVGLQYIIPRPVLTDGQYENEWILMFRGETDIMKITLIIFKIIFLFGAGAMVIGNIKSNKKLMAPFLKLKLMVLAGVTESGVIGLPLAYSCAERYAEALITFGMAIVVIVLLTHFFMIVNLRMRQIDGEALWARGDAENPPSVTDVDTLVHPEKE